MKRNKRFIRFSAFMLAVIVAISGMSLMLIINHDNNIQAKAAEEAEEEIIYDNPQAGIAQILQKYVAANGKSSIDYLSNTAVGINAESNKYYDPEGGYLGRLVVCTAEEGTVIYSEPSADSEAEGTLAQYGIGTLVSAEGSWIKLVSGNVAGYAYAYDFAYGKDAEDLEDLTYVTTAFVNTDELTLREEQSMVAFAMCILAEHSVHEVVEEDYDTDWTKVYVEGVGEGYILTYYLIIETSKRYAVSVEEAEIAREQIAAGVEEAAAREAMWTADRLAREEAQREAEQAAAEAARHAEELARQAAEAASREEAERLAQEADEAAWEAAYAASMSSDEGWEEASANAQAAAGYASDAWEWAYEAAAAEEAAEYEAYTYNERQQLVDYACSFAGWLPYVTGGASLVTGADCSGFTSAIYAAFGYTISRSSEAQKYVGYSVPLSQALPGDIIIYPGHVAIYVGDGLKVHSPYPGECVTINSMYNMTILDVRRIID